MPEKSISYVVYFLPIWKKWNKKVDITEKTTSKTASNILLFGGSGKVKKGHNAIA